MGFISPHELHIPIITFTKNNILLVKGHVCDIGTFSTTEYVILVRFPQQNIVFA